MAFSDGFYRKERLEGTAIEGEDDLDLGLIGITVYNRGTWCWFHFWVGDEELY